MNLKQRQRRNQPLKRPARVVSLDEMWTYQKARKGVKRNRRWVWTAVTEWGDGSRSVDFEVETLAASVAMTLIHMGWTQYHHEFSTSISDSE